MNAIDPARSTLLVIDFQARLMPAIHQAEAAMANARRLIDAARIIGIPALATEQNPKGLGGTVEGLAFEPDKTIAKMEFDATRAEGFVDRLPQDRPDLVVCGCEAHVCVLQTVAGLLDAGRRVHVVADAIGSRKPESREAAILRMQRFGADIVTTEMVVFEWLQTAGRADFKQVSALIR